MSTISVLNQPYEHFCPIQYTKRSFDMVDFGNRLKKLRLQNNLSQAQLADRLGLTKSVISAYENSVRMPSYEVLISISRIFKVTTDFLLGVETNSAVDLSGLTAEEVRAVKNLINAIKNG